MSIKVGVSGVVRSVNSVKVGVEGVVRNVTKGLTSIGGVIKQFLGSLPPTRTTLTVTYSVEGASNLGIEVSGNLGTISMDEGETATMPVETGETVGVSLLGYGNITLYAESGCLVFGGGMSAAAAITDINPSFIVEARPR